MRRIAFTAVFVLTLISGGQAFAASPIENAIAVFHGGTHVYVDSNAELAGKADAATITAVVGSLPVYVAVLPASAAAEVPNNDTTQIPVMIGKAIGLHLAVLTISGQIVDGAADLAALSKGQAETFARQAGAEHPGDPVAIAKRFVNEIDNAEAVRPSNTPEAVLVNPGGDPPGPSSTGGFGLAGFVVLLLLVVGGGVFVLSVIRRSARTKRRREAQVAEARADAESLYQRLGNDVSLLSAQGDPVCAQALADAGERFTMAGSILGHSTTVGQLRAVRRTAIEGLTATRVVRAKQGLDLGPELPPMDTTAQAPQLTEQQTVRVQGQGFQGYPGYAPGAPYYFGGGYHSGGWIPGGWYSTPFWEPLLLGAGLGLGIEALEGGGGWGGGPGGGPGGGGVIGGVISGGGPGGGGPGGGGDWGGGGPGGGGDWGGGGPGGGGPGGGPGGGGF